MTIIYLLLLLAAIGCFLAAAFRGTTETGRVRANLVALGLAFWVAVPLLQTIRALD